MFPPRRSVTEAALALASLLTAILIAAPSRSIVAIATDSPMQSEHYSDTYTATADIESKLERHLFELASPFDFANDQCALACNFEEEENDEGPLINACPKCHGQYTPCNFCCYEGASSLKLRFFGCPGNTSIVFDDTLTENGCDDGATNSVMSTTINSSVRFVDCDCYDNAIDASSSSFGDIESCTLFDFKIFGDASSHFTASSFDLCLVSTTDHGNGHIANFSQPLPEIIGLKHLPNGDTPFTDSVTFFETTCDETGLDSLENFALPVFPGYGKFAGTCPHYGFIDFKNENSRLPDDIVFLGQPPSTSFFYQFIDGTSVGFWPNADDNSDDMSVGGGIFFDPTFAGCECLDCNLDASRMPSDSPSPIPTSDPMSPTDGTPQQPDFGTDSPSTTFSYAPSVKSSIMPSIESSNVPSTLDPKLLPSSDPSLDPSIRPSDEPSVTPSSGLTMKPSYNPSESPSGSFFPSMSPSDTPSISTMPSISPSNSSENPTISPSVYPSLSPSENPSEAPSASYYPSHYPTNTPSMSIMPSASPSIHASDHPSDHPTHLSSEVPSSDPSASPTTFHPITYRCPPTSVPTPVSNMVTPSPVEAPPVPSTSKPSSIPTNIPTVSTESPSGVPSTSNPSSIPTNFPTVSTESPSGVPTTSNPSSMPTNLPTVSTESPSGVPTTSNPSSMPTNLPTVSTEIPSVVPTTSNPSSMPTNLPTVSTEIPSVVPTTSKPSSMPTNLTTVSTDSPTEIVSTELPTGVSTTFIPTQSQTDVGCVDETECFIFAVGNCIDRDTNAICIPHMNGGFRRYLEDQVRFHQTALDGELLNLKLRGRNMRTPSLSR